MTTPVCKFIELCRDKNLLQWENYTSAAQHSLAVLDKKLFDLFSQYQTITTSLEREQQLWKKLRVRALVDSDGTIAALRNKLDDWDNYPSASRLELARGMKPDVEELFLSRQERAIELGYPSYPHLIYDCEDLSSDFVQQIVNRSLEQNLMHAKDFISRHRLKQESWFRQLSELTAESRQIEFTDELSKVGRLFGCEDELNTLSIKILKQPISGIVISVNPPQDVRLLVSPITSLNQLRTFYHELGHGLAAVCNEEQGLLGQFSAVYDEVMAVIFEKMALKAMLEEDARKKLSGVEMVEVVRLATSHNFEKQLWTDLNFSRAEEWFSQGWAELGVEVDCPALWSIDSFRSIDPVYVHNYVLGEYFGRQFVQLCEKKFGSDYEAWFQFLKTHLLYDGMSRPFMSKMNLKIFGT